MMPNPFEDAYRNGKRVAVLGFLNKLIPHGTEVVLQLRKSVACVKFGKCFNNPEVKGLGEIGVTNEMDQVGERYAVSLCEIVLTDTFWNAQVVQSKSSPTIIALPHTCDDEGNYTSYIRGE
jgi:hypothetical protein